MRAAALQSVREAARDLSVALREQKAARERAARARRVRGEQRVRVQVFINRLGSRRRRSDARRPARVAFLEEVLQMLSAGGGGARLLPEGRGELPLAHRDLPRHVQRRVQRRVSPVIRGEVGERRVAASARRSLGAAVREALELLLQVLAVVHGAPAGRGSVQRRLDVARRQIDEVQERLHLAVGARHRALSRLSSASSVLYAAMVNPGALSSSAIAQALTIDSPEPISGLGLLTMRRRDPGVGFFPLQTVVIEIPEDQRAEAVFLPGVPMLCRFRGLFWKCSQARSAGLASLFLPI